MRKSLYLVLSLLVVFSLGAVFLHCGDDGDGPCECPEGQECCTECGNETCPDGERCDFMNNECGDCCADLWTKTSVHIWVSGKVLDLTTQQGVKASLTPISPMDALTEPEPEHLADTLSGDDGTFKTDCFDVTEVTLGCVVLSDDENFDGTGGTYFPSGSGVAPWGADLNEKYCVEEAKVFAVPNTLVAALDQYTSVDSANGGFVMGFVVDASYTPVAGAVVTKGDGTALAEVVYPNATFTDFSGTETSATGIYVLPHTNFSGLGEITAEKTGMTFGKEQAAPKPGFCYFTYIQAE